MGRLVPPPIEAAGWTLLLSLSGQPFGGLGEEHFLPGTRPVELEAFTREGWLTIPRAPGPDRLWQPFSAPARPGLAVSL